MFVEAKGEDMRAVAIVRDPHTGMNKTESAYADRLELLKGAGEIIDWSFQPEKLRLSYSSVPGKKAASGPAFYTPDFRVQASDGTIEFHETKGHWRTAAKVRIRVAADLHPMFRFVAVYKEKTGWKLEEIT